MTLDHPALWGIDASLEELRGKIGHLVKCAIQNSKVAWSNFSAKRCRGTLHTFKNVGTSLSRVLAVISPGGFEKFFLEAGKPATEGSSPPEGEPDVRRIVEIGQKYGMEIPPPPPEQ